LPIDEDVDSHRRRAAPARSRCSRSESESVDRPKPLDELVRTRARVVHYVRLRFAARLP
jgi:hypothetical protein